MLIEKLSEAAGKLAIETTPENSHQVEEMLENLVMFNQRHEKLLKFSKYLEKLEFTRI